MKKYQRVNFKHIIGRYQQQNKNIALTTINILINHNLIKINKNQIKKGIEKTKWHGRLDFVSNNVMIDASHNADGFKLLKKELLVIKKKKHFKNIIFVIGIQSDKDAFSMLKTLSSISSKFVFTKSNNPKALSQKKLLTIYNSINKNRKYLAFLVDNPKKALSFAKKIASRDDLIVVAGSIYVVGAVI